MILSIINEGCDFNKMPNRLLMNVINDFKESLNDFNE